MTTPYHRGERRVQQLAGAGDQAERVGQIIQSSVGAGARLFLSTTRALVLAASDRAGRCWVTHRVGQPGFVRADQKTVVVIGGVHPQDPIRAQEVGAFAGGIAIDMARRRRLRFNGRVDQWTDEHIGIQIDQVYGNCPQYIDPAAQYIDALPRREASRWFSKLTADQQDIIASAGFFFIGSAHPEHGADASHRGGPPGFVRVHDQRTLSFPDYTGNGMFNTLGNIAENPHIGLLFVHDSGTGLQLTGRASIHWGQRDDEHSPTGRRIEFALAQVVESRAQAAWNDAVPARVPIEPARPTGSPTTRSPGSAPSPGRRRAGHEN
jgi:predicted pyridoxine 5'-phosphate oxidase superfamily flavin-nucleotide-binding protein